MKVGICLPYMKRDYSRETILEWCRRVDAGPFSTLACGERVTGYTYDMRVLLSAAAAVTERVRIHPTLYVLPMHSAVRVAKEVATLDVLSQGRMDLTVGVGGREADYRALDASFEGRHARMDEQVAAMKGIWAGEPVFDGADPVGPDPIQAGGPRVLAGAMGPKAMARAARWADGIYAWSGNGQGREIERLQRSSDEAWQAAGREKPTRRLAGFWCSLAPNGQAELQDYVYRYLKIFGDEGARAAAKTMNRSSRDAVRESLVAMAELGCDETLLVPATADLAEIDEAAEVIASL